MQFTNHSASSWSKSFPGKFDLCLLVFVLTTEGLWGNTGDAKSSARIMFEYNLQLFDPVTLFVFRCSSYVAKVSNKKEPGLKTLLTLHAGKGSCT